MNDLRKKACLKRIRLETFLLEDISDFADVELFCYSIGSYCLLVQYQRPMLA
jgi:hypothetical protein